MGVKIADEIELYITNSCNIHSFETEMGKLKKALFMLQKMKQDFHRLRMAGYDLAQDMHSSNLVEYYFLFKEELVGAGKEQALIKRFDEDGIPINKTYIDVTDKDYVYFPISIGQMGLSVWHTYLSSKRDEDAQRFLKFADWFLKHAEIDDRLGARWMTEVALPAYKNPGPWQSAFSQSRGISVLLRAYQLTGREEYRSMAEQALQPFTISVADGGVTSFTEWGPFYEEYTSEVPTLVLNGMIFALCGVQDYRRVFPDHPLASRLFDEAVDTLISIMPQFDLGYWSRYNICEADWYADIDPATILYQKLHITQMRMMHQLTGHMIFKKYEEIFTRQITTTNVVKMYKVKYKALKKIGRL